MTDQLVASRQDPEAYEVLPKEPTEWAMEVTAWLATVHTMSRLSQDIPRTDNTRDVLDLCHNLRVGQFGVFSGKIENALRNRHGYLYQLLSKTPFAVSSPRVVGNESINPNLKFAVSLYKQDQEAIDRAKAGGVDKLVGYVEEISDFFTEGTIDAFGRTELSGALSLDLMGMIIHRHGQARFYVEKYYQEDKALAA